MNNNIIAFVGAGALMVALAIGFTIVKPVLAQVDATSTQAVASSAAASPVADRAPVATSTNDTVASSTAPASVPAESNAASTTAAATPPDTTPSQGKAQASAEGVAHGKPPTDSPPPGLALVHIVGTKYVDYFTDGSTTISVPGDPKVDGNLDKPNAPIPTHAGMTWVHTTGQHLYDTPSGDLEVGDYAVEADGSYIQHAPPFVSSTSTPAQLPTSMTDSTTASASSTSPTTSSVPDTSTSTATAASNSPTGTTTSPEPTTSPAQ